MGGVDTVLEENIMIGPEINQKVLSAMLEKLEAPNNLIYLCYRGSIAHNTFIPPTEPNSTSDVDLMGVYILPKEYYIGISQHKTKYPTTIEIKKEVDGVLLDCVFYEVRHFITMALKSNPNVFCALWVNPQHILLSRHMFDIVINAREHFLSRRCIYKSFTGYADSQLRSMEKYSKSAYMGEKRKRLIEKYGYDVKNAAVLITLLNIGIEALNTGKINVYRTHDVDMIKGIKCGYWKLYEIKLFADDLFNRSKKAYELSTVQEEPKSDLVENILMNMLSVYINKNRIIL